jgi:hypothetical protein
MQARCNAGETFCGLGDPIVQDDPTIGEGVMDLAMMFGVFIFGTFGVGTALFLYKL